MREIPLPTFFQTLNDALLRHRQNDNRGSFFWLSCVLCILALLTVTLTVGTVPVTADHQVPDGYIWANETHIPEDERFDRMSIVGLYSGKNVPTFDSELYLRIDEWVSGSDHDARIHRLEDFDYAQPPEILQPWNEYQLRTPYRDYIREESSLETSVYPYHLTESSRESLQTSEQYYIQSHWNNFIDFIGIDDRRLIDDAHITIFNIHPSTIVHEGTQGITERGPDYDKETIHIRGDGSVSAVADFRVDEHPVDYTDCSGSLIDRAISGDECTVGDERYEFSVADHGFTQGTLTASTKGRSGTTTTQDVSTPQDGTFDFDYDLADTTGEVTFTVQTDAYVQFDKTTYVYSVVGEETVECDFSLESTLNIQSCVEDGTRTVDVKDWVRDSTKTLEKDTLTISESLEVFRPTGYIDDSGFEPTAEIATLPGGRSQVFLDLSRNIDREAKWGSVLFETTNPSVHTSLVPVGGRETVEIQPNEPLTSESTVSLDVRGDFDLPSKILRVEDAFGNVLYEGQTGHSDEDNSMRRDLGELPIHETLTSSGQSELEMFELYVSTTESVTTPNDVQPRVWFRVSHEPRATNQFVKSQWHFFGARHTGWDVLASNSDSGVLSRTSYEISPVRPVWLRAYPRLNGLNSNVIDLKTNQNFPAREALRKAPQLKKSDWCAHTHAGRGARDPQTGQVRNTVGDVDLREEYPFYSSLYPVGEMRFQSNDMCYWSFPVAGQSEDSYGMYSQVQELQAITRQTTESIRVVGLVDGQEVQTRVTDERTVERVQLSTEPDYSSQVETEFTDPSGDTLLETPITVTLENEYGEPLNLKNRGLADEFIEIDNSVIDQEFTRDETIHPSSERFETGPDGVITATVYVSESRPIRVSFSSPHWSKTPPSLQAYAPETSEVSSTTPSGESLFQNIWVLSGILMLPLILIYVITKKFGVKLGLRGYVELLGRFIPPVLWPIILFGLLLILLTS